MSKRERDREREKNNVIAMEDKFYKGQRAFEARSKRSNEPASRKTM